MKVTTTEYFIVRDRIAGGVYLTTRRSRSNVNQPAYRWIKARRSNAVRFTTYDAAQKAAKRYGGNLVRCVDVVIGDFKTTFQAVVS